MAVLKFDQKAFRPQYLGFAAVVATLPVYEPALHSFHTIAPDVFDPAAGLFSDCAFAAMLACALAVLVATRRPVARTGGSARSGVPAALDPGTPAFKATMAAFGLVGAAGLCLISRFPLPAAAVGALGACAGAGSALALLAWGRLFMACTKKVALLHLALTSVLGAFLLNTVGTLPYPAAVALFMGLEVVALAVPAFHLEVPGAPDATGPGATGLAPASRTPLAVHMAEPLLGIALFALSFQVLGAHTVYLFYLSFLLGTIVAGLAVLPVLLLDAKRPAMALLYEIVLPLAGFAVVAATVAAPDALQALTTRNGFMVFYAFAILLFLSSTIAFANAGEYDPRRVFATAIAFYAGASLAGTIVGSVASEQACNDGFTVLTLVYLVFLALRPNVAAWRHPQSAGMAVETGARVGAGAGARTDAGPGTADDAAAGPLDQAAPGETPAPQAGALDDEALARACRRWGLTGREAEVLPLLAQGRTSAYIARTLYISDSTARGHAHKIYQKAGVSTREGLLAALADDGEPSGYPEQGGSLNS